MIRPAALGVMILAASLGAQSTPTSTPTNLLDNPDAILSRSRWLAFGDAKIESCGGDPCFVVRNHGTFQQIVTLPADAAGKSLVLIGSGSSERVHTDAAITGLPYLYALVEAARFDRVGLYLFASASDARTFVETWKGRDPRPRRPQSGMVPGIPHQHARGHHGRRGHATTGLHEGVPARRPA